MDHFGYRQEGDGRVLYAFNGEPDYSVIEDIVKSVYIDKYDGEIDYSEYDPSIIEVDKYLIEDTQSLTDVIESESYEEQTSFFETVLEFNIVLIFIDMQIMTVEQIRLNKLKNFLNQSKDLILFAREYDHIYDY